MTFEERIHKFFGGRKNGLPRHQCDHHLPRAVSRAHLHIADQPGPPVFVVDTQLERFHECEDCLDDPVRTQVFKQAGFDRNDLMRARLIYAADRPALSVRCKHRSHLVSVMIRILHADDGIHAAEGSDQVLHKLLFLLRLLLVRNVDHGTSAALFGYRTAGPLLFRSVLRCLFVSLLCIPVLTHIIR